MARLTSGRPVVPALTGLLLIPALAPAFTPGAFTVADFSATPPSSVPTTADERVTSVSVVETSNPLDQSRAALFSASLSGPGASWAGISLPVETDQSATASAVLAGADHVELDLRGEGETRGVTVTLTEQDGSRWNANVRVSADWVRVRLPLYQFFWFTGPAGRQETRPDPANLKSVDVWTGNTFQGPNGFGVDNVRVADSAPTVMLRLIPPAEPLPVQQDSRVMVETVETTGGPVVPFSGQLWLSVANPDDVLVPTVVPVEEGRAEIPVFAREYGPFSLTVYEPSSRAELTALVPVTTDGARIRLGIRGLNNTPVVFNNQLLPTWILVKAPGTTVPQSAHVRITDHTGRTVMARNESLENLRVGKSSLKVPGVGMFQIEMTAVAEPVSELPRAQGVPEAPLDRALRTGTIQRYVNLPEGITTATVLGNIIPLADLPSTATVIARDRLTVWSLAKSPVENAGLYRSPFGVHSGIPFSLSENEISALGQKQLDWHRRLGSFWGYNELLWDEIEPTPGSFSLSKARKIGKLYEAFRIKLVAVLGYGSAWAENGAAPNTPEERSKFRNYVRKLTHEFSKPIWAFQVWNEPDTAACWKPQPDMDAYRELVKVTWEELRGGETSAPERIVAGGTAGYNPAFLEHLMKDGYARYFDVLSLQLHPEVPDRSPEENNLPEVLDAFRRLRSRYQAGEEGWISEIGWPTRPGGVSETDQANYLLRTYVIALANGISKVFWHSLQDGERLPWAGGFRAHTGLLDADYRPKPSFIAYNLLEFMLAELRFAGLKRQGNAVVYTFDILEQIDKNSNGRIHVAWTLERGASEEVDLPITGGGPVYAFDFLGAEQVPELISKAQGRPSPDGAQVHTHEVEEEGARAAAAETSPTLSGATYVMPPAPDDEPTTRTYRFRATYEPLYIWDAGTRQRRR